jgi:hypothetical protein
MILFVGLMFCTSPTNSDLGGLSQESEEHPGKEAMNYLVDRVKAGSLRACRKPGTGTCEKIAQISVQEFPV